MPQHERRINTRIPAEFKVNYVHNGDYIISYTKDLSVDGMFIYTKNPPPVGDSTKLIFSIGELNDVSVSTRVIWVNQDKESLDSGMGVRFIDSPDALRNAILQTIKKVALLNKDS